MADEPKVTVRFISPSLSISSQSLCPEARRLTFPLGLSGCIEEERTEPQEVPSIDKATEGKLQCKCLGV